MRRADDTDAHRRRLVLRDQPPLPLAARWLFQINGKSFNARHLRQRHIDWYRDQYTRANGDPKRRCRALYWLLRTAFPWRLSYLLASRGDPVKLVLAADPPEQTRALAELLSHVRRSPGSFFDTVAEALNDG